MSDGEMLSLLAGWALVGVVAVVIVIRMYR